MREARPRASALGGSDARSRERGHARRTRRGHPSSARSCGHGRERAGLGARGAMGGSLSADGPRDPRRERGARLVRLIDFGDLYSLDWRERIITNAACQTSREKRQNRRVTNLRIFRCVLTRLFRKGRTVSAAEKKTTAPRDHPKQIASTSVTRDADAFFFARRLSERHGRGASRARSPTPRVVRKNGRADEVSHTCI
jgi:hypothetical protein